MCDLYDTLMQTDTKSPDPLAVLRDLTIPEIEERITDLDGERKALSVLLRSLRARERARSRTAHQLSEDGADD